MPRTPAQEAADTALTDAIERCTAAYRDEWSDDGDQDAPAVLTSYVVLTASRAWDDHGDGLTIYGMLHRDSDVPLHECLGLVAYADARYRAQCLGDE